MKDSTADSANDTGLPALLGYISGQQAKAMAVEKLLDAAMALHCRGDQVGAIDLLAIAEAKVIELNRALDYANLLEVTA